MSVMRSINSRFWSDGWIRKLNALDRYAFLYFLTNEHSNWCGIYEVDLAMIAFETGIDEADLTRAVLPRLVPKIIYVDGWVYIPNFPRYHLNRSEDTKKGYERAFNEVPERIRLKIKEIKEGGVTPPTLPPFTSAFTSTSTLLPAPEGAGGKEDVEIVKDESRMTPAEFRAYQAKGEGYQGHLTKPLMKWAEERMGKRFPKPLKQLNAIASMIRSGYGVEAIKEAWIALEGDDFWSEKGIDFGVVLNQIGKAKKKKKGIPVI